MFDYFGNRKKHNIEKNKSKHSYFKKFTSKNIIKEEWIPKTIYSKEQLLKNFLKKPNFCKTISVSGHLHHGKSSFVNLLASSVHLINDEFLVNTFINLSFSEQERNLTIYPNIISLMLYSNQKNSKIYNFIDCPGHPDFQDQVLTSMQVSDGVILMVDLVEGVMIGTEISLKNAITSGLPLVVILNSLDRLFIELNLSPIEIHIRIISVIDELNMVIQKILEIHDSKKKKQFKYFNPILNNVCFSSLIQGWTFTVEQFSEIYLSSQPSCCLSIKDLSHFIWNCLSVLDNKNCNQKNSKNNGSFLFQDLILYPLLKLIFFNLTESYSHIRKLIETELGVFGIKINEFSLSSERVFNLCISLFLGGCREVKLVHNHSGIIKSINYHIVTNKKRIDTKLSKNKILKKKADIGYIMNFFFNKKSNKTMAICKILNGKIKIMDKVKILTSEPFFYKGQKYFSFCQVKRIYISLGRYTIKITKALEGMLVFISGFEFNSKKNGIFYNLLNTNSFSFFPFSSIKRYLINCKIGKILKIIVKPVENTNLDFFFKALRICSKIYPNFNCQIKSNGNIILSSTSELYLDCILKDLKEILGKIEFQLSEPYLPLRETVLIEKKIFIDYLKKNLTLQVRNSIFPTKSNFSMLGFLGIYKNVYSKFKKTLFLLNSISGGYLSNKMNEKLKFKKIDANGIWFFDLDKIDSSNSFFKGFPGLNIPFKDKKINSSWFKKLMKKGPLLSEVLNGVEFALKEEKDLCIDIDLLKKNVEKLKNNLFDWGTGTIDPVFLGDIVFPDVYFPLILKYLKIKSARILSYDNFFGEKIIIIRIQISGKMLIEFDHEISLLTQNEGFSFFLFDSWKNDLY